ncbi:MAG: hypothetical protein M3Z10_09050 [Gemmatimonadota bacterium]|nr:hypothetical protein [Gemmatimonadota bacterium]
MRSRRRFLALLILWSAACAANQQSGSAPRGVDRNVLTQQEMLDQHFVSAYDAVEALRSQWLQARGPDSFKSPSQVWVYQDNVKLGNVETLRSVAVSSIVAIRRLSPNEATARWGVGHAAGVIYVQTMSASPSPPPPDGMSS